MKAVTYLEKVIAGEASAVAYLEKVIAQETTAVTYTEKVIAGTAPPITHLQKVIAGVARPVTHLEYVWAGGSPPSVQEYTGAVPATFVADGTPLLDYLISGNTVQNGTPTPDSPIMPQGTGEKTGNLFDAATAYGAMYSGGVITGQANAINDTKNKVTTDMIGKTYTISITPLRIASRAYMSITINGTTYWRENELTVNQRSSFQFTPVTENDQWFITYDIGGVCSYKDIMVNEGSTPLPYEPYGVKIPISSANTTTPVYFGEVQSTRKIRKLVLTGEEKIYKNYPDNVNDYLYYTSISELGDSINNVVLCTHLPYTPSTPEGTTIGSRMSNSHKSVYFNFGADVMNSQPSGNTRAGIAEYLAAQYAAGTPVTVWYVLANEETAVVNEPLMRISDYVDTLSMEQAGVQIPTANGSTTLDVETAVKPSEVYIKYRGEAVATLSSLPAEVSSPEETPEEADPEETEETENGSEDISLQHEFEAIE